MRAKIHMIHFHYNIEPPNEGLGDTLSVEDTTKCILPWTTKRFSEEDSGMNTVEDAEPYWHLHVFVVPRDSNDLHDKFSVTLIKLEGSSFTHAGHVDQFIRKNILGYDISDDQKK